MEKTTNTFKTTDIRTSAFLLSKNVQLTDVIKDNPRKILFCFPDTILVKTLLKNYWKDQASVNPRVLFESLEQLKDIIHRDYEV